MNMKKKERSQARQYSKKAIEEVAASAGFFDVRTRWWGMMATLECKREYVKERHERRAEAWLFVLAPTESEHWQSGRVRFRLQMQSETPRLRKHH